MKTLKTVALGALVMCSSYSHAGKISMMLEYGLGGMSVDSRTFEEQDFQPDSASYSSGIYVGYQFDNHILLAGAVNSATNNIFWGAADSVSLYESGILIGYSFDLSPRWSIVPIVELSRWTLDAKEGAFLNPGPEEEASIDGSQLLGRVNLEARASDILKVQLSYRYGRYEFGQVQSTRLGLKLEF